MTARVWARRAATCCSASRTRSSSLSTYSDTLSARLACSARSCSCTATLVDMLHSHPARGSAHELRRRNVHSAAFPLTMTEFTTDVCLRTREMTMRLFATFLLLSCACTPWPATTSPADAMRQAEELEIRKHRDLYHLAEAAGDKPRMCRAAAVIAHFRGKQNEQQAYEYWLAKQHENCVTAGWNGKETDG